MENRYVSKEFSRDPTVDDLINICSHLNEKNAEHIIIGGFAMIHYGFLRGTADIDLLINPSSTNVNKIKQALLSLPDKASKKINISDVSKYQVVRIADEIVVDLISKACDVTFNDAKDHIINIKIKNVEIPYLDVSMLIKSKKTLRQKDYEDRIFLERLLKEQNRK